MTVIAGYPWFGDWGRDTMIALPGLALTTGRPELAARVLRTFARFVDRGMLPNRFPDGSDAPEYNTVDATLWWIEAIRATHAATGDAALLKELWPVLESVVEWHRRGTRYGIGEDPGDGLLRAGEPGVQLTWMDARVGDWVVTPRIGKPVEINALWYNALAAMAGFARALERPHRAVGSRGRARSSQLRPLLVRGRRALLRRGGRARRRRRRAAAEPDLRRLAAREPAAARAAAPRGRRLCAPPADVVRAAQPRARPSGVLRVLPRHAAGAGRRLSPGHGVGLAARTVRAGPRARVRRSRGSARVARADAPPPRRLRRRLDRGDLRRRPRRSCRAAARRRRGASRRRSGRGRRWPAVLRRVAPAVVCPAARRPYPSRSPCQAPLPSCYSCAL